MNTFPTLYRKNSNGKIQQWNIEVKANKIIVEYGVVGGKQQLTVDVITEGKNIGKTNQTDPEQQAQAEALSKWTKKKNEGFVESIDDAKGNVSSLVCYEPMLAHKYGVFINDAFYPEHNRKIKFPCAVQPKFDGIRCCTHEDFTLWSRKNKPFNSVPHIQRALKEVDLPYADGELYRHDLKHDFEKIVSIVKQSKKPAPNHEIVEYHIYDVAIPDMTFYERNRYLVEKLGDHEGPLKLVQTIIVESHEELVKIFRNFEKQDYEGAIVRNLDGKYEHKRSYHLQKLKSFFDKEFPIVGIKEGSGKFKGCAIFICKLENGETVDVVLEGGLERLKYYFKHPDEAIGKEMTIRFQGYTKDGSLRFPVGVALRDYE